MNAARAMRGPVVTVHGGDTWREALRLLLGGSLNALTVVDDAGAVIGIVTQTDLASRIQGNERTEMRAILDGILTPVSHRTLLRWHQAPEWGGGARVESVMTAAVVTVPPDAPLAVVARLLLAHDIRQAPVVDAANRPLGMIGQRDLVAALATGAAIPAIPLTHAHAAPIFAPEHDPDRVRQQMHAQGGVGASGMLEKRRA